MNAETYTFRLYGNLPDGTRVETVIDVFSHSEAAAVKRLRAFSQKDFDEMEWRGYSGHVDEVPTSIDRFDLLETDEEEM